jgi:choline dehydrogenase-like flavoprotein
MNTSHFDVIIIGTGAGGGTLAYRLAPTGARILLLERGGYVPREKDNWSSHAVNVAAKYHTTDVWTDADNKPLHPHTNYYVGGNTKFYGAALFRLRRQDFGQLTHHGGISPAWPISYDEMEPYYAEAEQLYHVHGARGEDPTDPPASGPYPHPAVSHEPRMQQLSDHFSALGLRPFHVPLGIMLDESNPQQSACIRCNTCDGFACLVHAKSAAQVVCVDPALKHGNVTLLTDATLMGTSSKFCSSQKARVCRSGTGPDPISSSESITRRSWSTTPSPRSPSIAIRSGFPLPVKARTTTSSRNT